MDDLKYLKMHYGEEFAHLCRSLFPTILKHEGKLASIIESKFAHSKFLAKDLRGMEKEFKDFIYEIYEKDYKKAIFKLKNKKTPEELMDEAGYILYPECKTEEDIQNFRKYWYREDGKHIEYKGGNPQRISGDELCTFDGGRLDTCRVWFAIKKDIDKIKREDYKVQKENEYDLSALSIQFDKFGIPNLSIKGRYNHSVPCPDSTLDNNLDNIIPGLSEAFGIIKNVPQVKFKPNKYIVAEDGKFYRFFGHNFSTYFCENGYVINNGKVTHFNPDRYILTSNGYLFDTKYKQLNLIYLFEINNYGEYDLIFDDDSFVKTYKKITKIDFVKTEKGDRNIVISQKGNYPVIIGLNNENAITSIIDPNIVVLPENYLNKSEDLETIKMDNLKLMNDGCFEFAPNVKNLKFPNLQQINSACFRWAKNLKTFEANNLKRIDNNSFVWLDQLKKFDAPNLKRIGDNCFFSISDRTIFNTPNLKKLGFGCFVGYINRPKQNFDNNQDTEKTL